MYGLEGEFKLRYFNWNKETVRLTGDKVEKICTSDLNYVPFLYVFGSVCLMVHGYPLVWYSECNNMSG